MSDSLARPLAGLTIVELPGGVATRYCGRLFAVQGATVIRAGASSNAGTGYDGAARDAYAAWLDQDKALREAPLATVLAGLAHVDLVIAGQDPQQVLRADAVLAGRPPVRRLGLTWFAPDGPYRQWTGSDAVIQAMSGVAYPTGPIEGLPMLPRGHAPQVVGGATGFIAAMAAILGPPDGATRIDVDLLSANQCFSESGTCALALSGERVVRRGVNRFTPTFPGGIWRASDGWIGVTALTPPQWQALCRLIGDEALARDPRHATSLERLNRADAIDPVLAGAFRQRTAAWWLAQGQAHRIPFAPVPDLAELPRTPHWQGRGSFAAVPGVARAIGPTLPFHAARADGFVHAGPAAPAFAGGRGGAEAVERPLRGLKVLDLSMGWAGPLAARHFADLGAEVVKVESCTHVDWWRGFDGELAGDPPPYEVRPAFLMVNRNKHGVTLDLKTEEGCALLRRLAARSDLVIENYAPGVLEKLGVGPRALLAEQPGLVCLSMGAFGASGPWHRFRAYGSTVEQASGLPFVNGAPGDPPTMAHVAYGDPVAGIYGAVACLSALYGRLRDPSGSAIDLGQVECLFQLNADAIVAQSVRDDPLPREGDRHPASLLRLVAATRTGAVAVSVETPAQWAAIAGLCGPAGMLFEAGGESEDTSASDARLAVAALRFAQCKALEPAMAAAVRLWAGARDAAEVVDALQSLGVAAGPVLGAHDLLHDAQLVARGFWQRLSRPYIGEHYAPAAPYRLDGRVPPIAWPAPTLGEHNATVLGGVLGLDADARAALEARGIIGTRARADAPGPANEQRTSG